MQLSFKEHFQLIVFQKLWDWRLEKSYMRNHTCLLDLHQRSHYVTIGHNNWVQKLIDNRKKKLLDKQNFSNQANQSQNQSVIDQGQPDNKHEVFVDKGETSWSREIKEKSSHGELCSSDRSGQPDITPSVIRAQTNLSREIRVEQTHDLSGQPDEHNVALQEASWSTSWDYDAQHRQWVNSSKNWGRHGLQHSRTTTFYFEAIAECQRSRIDSENREPPEPTCSSTRPTTESIIQSLQPRIRRNDSWSRKRRIVRITRHGTQNAVQSMFIILGHRHRLVHVRALLAKRNRGK